VWNQRAIPTTQINNDYKLETSPLTHMVRSSIKKTNYPQTVDHTMKKNGVLQLALHLIFELKWPLVTHHIFMLWVLLDKLHKLHELQLTIHIMQFIVIQLHLCRNNCFSTTIQLPYDYNHNVMLTSFFIHSSKYNTWQYEDFLVI